MSNHITAQTLSGDHGTAIAGQVWYKQFNLIKVTTNGACPFLFLLFRLLGFWNLWYCVSWPDWSYQICSLRSIIKKVLILELYNIYFKQKHKYSTSRDIDTRCALFLRLCQKNPQTHTLTNQFCQTRLRIGRRHWPILSSSPEKKTTTKKPFFPFSFFLSFPLFSSINLFLSSINHTTSTLTRWFLLFFVLLL